MDTRINELMTFPRASERWNFERSYVYQQYKKYPEKFLPGTTMIVDSTGKRTMYVITTEGMEHLTGMNEKQANKGLWVVRHEQNYIVDFELRLDTEEEARELIRKKVEQDNPNGSVAIDFELINANRRLHCVRLDHSSYYTYEKIKK